MKLLGSPHLQFVIPNYRQLLREARDRYIIALSALQRGVLHISLVIKSLEDPRAGAVLLCVCACVCVCVCVCVWCCLYASTIDLERERESLYVLVEAPLCCACS